MGPHRALAMTVVILSFSLAGCTGGSSGMGNTGTKEIEVPTWETGDWWLYTFSTPDYSDDTAKLVVASTSEEDGTAYMLAISSLTEARRHAVLNHNPFLGRITHSDLAAFENGAPQQVLSFPIGKGDSWSFTLFSMEWSALVSDIAGSTAVVIANADDGSRLDYVFDSEIGFFQSFTWKDASGT